MKKGNVLITGGGSKLGLAITKQFLKDDYNVDVMTSSEITDDEVLLCQVDKQLKVINIDWWDVNEENLIKYLDKLTRPRYDIIIFNHSTGGGPNETLFLPYVDYSIKEWNMHYFINTQLPFLILKKIHKRIKPTTKIGWMLVSLIDGKWEDGWQYGGFTSFKSTNSFIMRGFSRFLQGISFGLVPGDISVEDRENESYLIKSTIENLTEDDNGKIIFKTGHELDVIDG